MFSVYDMLTQIGRTPLMFASEQGHTEIVKVLLVYGADADAQDEVSRTVLLCSLSYWIRGGTGVWFTKSCKLYKAI